MSCNIPDNPSRTASPYCAPGEKEPLEDDRFVFMLQTRDQQYSLVAEWLMQMALEDIDIAVREMSEAQANAKGEKNERLYMLHDLGKRFCDDNADEWRYE